MSRLQTELWTILESADTFKTAADVMAPLATALRDSLRVVQPKPVAAPPAAAAPKPRKKRDGALIAVGPTLSISEQTQPFDAPVENLAPE
jgi:hypothetical protein